MVEESTDVKEDEKLLAVANLSKKAKGLKSEQSGDPLGHGNNR